MSFSSGLRGLVATNLHSHSAVLVNLTAFLSAVFFDTEGGG
jgi:hypothetical protein